MPEITSPGKLLPTVDFDDMEAGQSDIRNITLAPVFKKLGIIEQWGNGLQLIADEMKNYPEIELQWKEPGMAFRVSFVKKNFTEQQDKRTITNDNERLPSEKSSGKSSGKSSQKILELITENKNITTFELADILKISRRAIAKQIALLKKEGKLKRIGPAKGGHWEVVEEKGGKGNE